MGNDINDTQKLALLGIDTSSFPSIDFMPPILNRNEATPIWRQMFERGLLIPVNFTSRNKSQIWLEQIDLFISMATLAGLNPFNPEYVSKAALMNLQNNLNLLRRYLVNRIDRTEVLKDIRRLIFTKYSVEFELPKQKRKNTMPNLVFRTESTVVLPQKNSKGQKRVRSERHLELKELLLHSGFKADGYYFDYSLLREGLRFGFLITPSEVKLYQQIRCDAYAIPKSGLFNGPDLSIISDYLIGKIFRRSITDIPFTSLPNKKIRI